MPTPTPTCHHIFAHDNHRCGSPALRGERFCYYHHPSRQRVANPYARRARRGFPIQVPTHPHDPAAKQFLLWEIIERLANNRIDVHRASLLIYSLQVAAQMPAPLARTRPAASE